MLNIRKFIFYKIIKISNSIFKGSKPIDGDALKALNHTILRIGKNKSSFKNRL